MASSISFKSTSRTAEIIFETPNLKTGTFCSRCRMSRPRRPRFLLSESADYHQLQFAQHELRSYDDAVEKSGLGNVRDAASIMTLVSRTS